MGLMKSLWRGEVSLEKTFWLYGMIGIVILHPAVFFYFFLVFSCGPICESELWYIPLVALVACYCIFISAAIWRSAGNHEGKIAWAWLAKTMVVLANMWIAVLIVVIIYTDYYLSAIVNKLACCVDVPSEVKRVIVIE